MHCRIFNLIQLILMTKIEYSIIVCLLKYYSLFNFSVSISHQAKIVYAVQIVPHKLYKIHQCHPTWCTSPHTKFHINHIQIIFHSPLRIKWPAVLRVPASNISPLFHTHIIIPFSTCFNIPFPLNKHPFST